MNYEKIVMELFSRVKELEEKVLNLDERLLDLEDDSNEPTMNEPNLEVNNVKITRSVSRNYVMNKLKESNPLFTVEKGNRAAGADIILTSKRQEATYTFKAKYYHSRSYENFVSGWHTVNLDDLKNEHIAFHIFTVEYQGQFHTFIFTTSELQNFIEDKIPDQNNIYHFYFRIANGRPIECRDVDKDASKYYERWTLPTEALK